MLMLSEDLPEGQVIFRIEIAHGAIFYTNIQNLTALYDQSATPVTEPVKIT